MAPVSIINPISMLYMITKKKQQQQQLQTVHSTLLKKQRYLQYTCIIVDASW